MPRAAGFRRVSISFPIRFVLFWLVGLEVIPSQEHHHINNGALHETFHYGDNIKFPVPASRVTRIGMIINAIEDMLQNPFQKPNPSSAVGSDADNPHQPSFHQQRSKVVETSAEAKTTFASNLWKEAARGEFSFQALIRAQDTPICGGALLSQTWVLTAAQCFDGRVSGNPAIELLRVILGEHRTSQREYGEQDFDVRAVVVHDQYSPTTKTNDIALILLDGIAEFSEFVQPVRLPPSRPEPIDEGDAIAAGWGYTAALSQGTANDILHSYSFPVIPPERCNCSWDGQMLQSHICVGDTDVSFFGDPGGPLMCKDFKDNGQLMGQPSFGGQGINNGKMKKAADLYDYIANLPEEPRNAMNERYLCGIVSHGSMGSVVPGFKPAVHTRVSYFLPWIKKSMADFIDASGTSPQKRSENAVVQVNNYMHSPNAPAWSSMDENGIVTTTPAPVADYAVNTLTAGKYPFVGLVRIEPKDGHWDENCVGTLLKEDYVLTNADCVQDVKIDRISVIFQGPEIDNFQTIRVADGFMFRADKYLMGTSSRPHRQDQKLFIVQGERAEHKNQPVVLQLASPVIYSNLAYPVNFARKQRLAGLTGTLEFPTGYPQQVNDPADGSPAVMPGTAFEILPPHECLYDETVLERHNLASGSSFCAKKFWNNTKCEDYPRGSPLLCQRGSVSHSGDLGLIPWGTSTSEGPLFLCGLLAHPEPEQKEGWIEEMERKANKKPAVQDRCYFRRIWIKELLTDESQATSGVQEKLSTYHLAIVGRLNAGPAAADEQG